MFAANTCCCCFRTRVGAGAVDAMLGVSLLVFLEDFLRSLAITLFIDFMMLEYDGVLQVQH